MLSLESSPRAGCANRSCHRLAAGFEPRDSCHTVIRRTDCRRVMYWWSAVARSAVGRALSAGVFHAICVRFRQQPSWQSPDLRWIR